jgi:hypothetical protein
MKKEAPENEASHFSHGLREAVFLFRPLSKSGQTSLRPKTHDAGVARSEALTFAQIMKQLEAAN